MNILIAVPWDQEFGGVAYVIGNLARYLQNRGHQVTFFFPGSTEILLSRKTTRWGFPGFQLKLLPLRFGSLSSLLRTIAGFLLFPITLYQLIRFLQRNRIEVVNVHYVSDRLAYFAICRRIVPIKLVCSVHGADLFPGGRQRRSYSRFLKFLLSSADLIVAPSASFRSECERLFPHLSRKMTFIHNGIDVKEFEAFTPTSEEESGRQRYLVCVAAHNEKKGLDTLIRAFSSLNDSAGTVKLMLVGDGPLRSRLERLAADLGLNGRVEFVGEKARAELIGLLRGCEIAILPSRAEPFGIAIIEALAARKPVVATKVGGIPEIIAHTKNGILVEPDDPQALAEALQDLLDNPKLRRQIAEGGYASVIERFLFDKTGSAYERAFEESLTS